jgi:hypothetical protein
MTLRKRSYLVEDILNESTVFDSKSFCDELMKMAPKGKALRCSYQNRFNGKYDSVMINFFNVPDGKAHGAYAENNRILLSIEGFSPELGSEPPRGKLSVEALVNSYRDRIGKIRKKTAAPKKVLEYVVGILKKFAAESVKEDCGLRMSSYLFEATTTLSQKERKKLEMAAWKKTHRDYRSMLGGERHVLVHAGAKGTTLMALSDMPDEELKKRARIK